MKLNRHHYFAIGTLLLLLGLNVRLVDTIYLNQPTTEFVQKRFVGANATGDAMLAIRGFMPGPQIQARQPVRPPRWLGYVMMSVGVVLILHSLALPKPG
jgi:hypothetical protein